jgi:hypothetical protein
LFLVCAADPALILEGSRQEQVFNSLLLDYLAAVPGGGSSSSSTGSSGAAAARRFVCSRMLHDAIFFRNRHADNARLDKEALSLLLVQHRQLQDSSHHVLGGYHGWHIHTLVSSECFVFCLRAAVLQMLTAKQAHSVMVQQRPLVRSASTKHVSVSSSGCRPWHG